MPPSIWRTETVCDWLCSCAAWGGVSVVSLVKQVPGQLSVMLDEIWFERQVPQNPLDIEQDELPIPKGARRDVALSHKFALGEGCGAYGARVKHPLQHMESFRMLLPSAKRPRKIDPRDVNEDLVFRYVQVQENIFLSCATHQWHLTACG